MDKKFKKGDYENSVEFAKELLDCGKGMSEIMNKTNLKEEDISKIQKKINNKLNDK
jgi:hypothetical protein